MRKISKSGMSFSLLAGFLWSLFPVISTLSFVDISPLTAAAFTTLFATVFFGVVVTVKGEWKMPSKAVMQNIAIACVLLGICYYVCTYIGLSLTTPGNSAIVGLSEIFFSYLFLSVFQKHEKLVRNHVIGSILMIAGVLFVLLPSAGEFRSGDIIILIGGMLPPFGNLAMQRARKEVSSSFIMFWRSLAGSIAMFILVFALGETITLSHVSSALPWLLFCGFVLMGFSKILWIEAIHRLPITQTISIVSIQPLFTLFFAYVMLQQQPEWMQLLSLPPLALGMYLLTKKHGVEKEALEQV